ncbi:MULTISPECIES: hypothetical protein [Ferrimonas]|uniref:Uncharacterized protein n=1 Tax=Ferrimonas sediminum TaxID=718193 RepID=A0A1G8TMZ4_9GAMM|nr:MULTISPECIES: hypothetical protein [Ferrimonas]USD36049.1 hypothetical protein J8Z22_13480 [Ferrimonas sp. SCSIO 43195]SDJ42898.1 hypothetical protein SAMN04488540_10834 [Ferrimonas sediminum]
MEWRVLTALAVLMIGNGYWAFRYYQTQHNKNIDGRQRISELENLQDHWLQFSTVAILLIMLLAPLARQALLSG